MRWNTRTHWIWGLLVPGAWSLFFLAIGGIGILTFTWWGLLASGLIAIVPILHLSTLWVRWRSFSLSISPTGKALLEQNGIVMIAERRINLNMMGSMTFEQTFMGRIWNYGTLSIGSLGGPYQWENLGQFRALRRIIESQGEWVPVPRPAILPIIQRWIRRTLLQLRDLWGNLEQTITRVLRERRTFDIRTETPTYEKFLRYAESILFPQARRRYESSFGLRGGSEFMFFRDEAELYYRILKARRVFAVDSHGKIHRHQRIHTVRDVRKHVPADWFQKAARVL